MASARYYARDHGNEASLASERTCLPHRDSITEDAAVSFGDLRLSHSHSSSAMRRLLGRRGTAALDVISLLFRSSTRRFRYRHACSAIPRGSRKGAPTAPVHDDDDALGKKRDPQHCDQDHRR